MPSGYECRARLIKQVPATPTKRRGKPSKAGTPAANKYEPPKIFCGPGYDKIKRAPAYTFGHRTPISTAKPSTTPFAPLYNIHCIGNKGGPFKIKHCVVSPRIEPVVDRTKTPGPAEYKPPLSIQYKRPPAYSLRQAAKPPFQPWDMWTPPPNMYCPPIPCKKEPAYTLGYAAKNLKPAETPGPGEHEPNFDFVKKTKPAFSFGAPFKEIKPQTVPPPNTYCEKKFMVSKRSIPAPSFGIRHSRYIGQQEVYLKSSKLDLVLNKNS